MGIVVNLDELLYARRMTLTDLADQVGITLANLSILKTGKAKAIRFSTLEALCRYRPTTVTEGLAVPGIGEAKAQRYLPVFLAVLKEWK